MDRLSTVITTVDMFPEQADQRQLDKRLAQLQEILGGDYSRRNRRRHGLHGADRHRRRLMTVPRGASG